MKELLCPHCLNHLEDMLELLATIDLPKLGEKTKVYLCLVCSKEFRVKENVT